MPLAFEDFQGKGVLDFSSSSSSSSPAPPQPPLLHQHHHRKLGIEEEQEQVEDGYYCYVSEPTSVLDTVRSPSPLTTTTSSSTLSSSHGSGGGGAASNASAEEKCPAEGQMGGGVEDWDAQEQSIFRLMMGDVEEDDPSIGLNKILQGNLGVSDPGFNLEPDSLCSSGFTVDAQIANNPLFSSVSLLPPPQPVFQQQALFEEKPQLLNPPTPQVIINQNQHHFSQNPAMFMPMSSSFAHLQQEHYSIISPPPAKRINPGFSRPMTPTTMAVHNHNNNNQQQAVIEQHLFKLVELIDEEESGGDSVLAQGILARLNQMLTSPLGKPFQRAAFYFKEALHKLLFDNNNIALQSSSPLPSYNLIFKIGAYKSFSEISPVLQFANFTSNQALLESFQGFNHIHIIDFDIQYGGQWASLMQELVLRSTGPPSLKITVFSSPSSNHDELELGFTQDNLTHFANEINIQFEIEILSFQLLNNDFPWHQHSSEKEAATAVNLPASSFSSYHLPSILRFVKRISPRIILSADRGCERTDLPFPHHLMHSLHSHSALLESLDAVNANLDAVEKIERFLIQPSIERAVLNRSRPMQGGVTWRELFGQMGFNPVGFSNFTESQAECLVQRTPIRGFHVEKKGSSIVLCWQRKELVAVSAWRC